MEKKPPRYFVAKVASIQDLKVCSESSQWACRERANPPQPADVLHEAFSTGPVILLFSVNNCHGWHGFAEMVSLPCQETINKTETDCLKPSESSKSEWKYFNVNWKVIYIQDFGERCPPSSQTEHLVDLTGSPVNKSRNWQELPVQTGDRLCHLMETFYKDLCLKREEKIRKQLENVTEPFYKTETQSNTEIWEEIIQKVEQELGKVVLACPFGSQRYNLSIADSDMDMFIVYQAKTCQMLGFHPPKQTVKNSESQSTDYTIHEIFRYAELLASGDSRCVETLFLNPSTVLRDSPEYQLLKTGRKQFLHRKTLDKYLRDAQGTHGTKLLRKWCSEHKEETVLTPKMCKLLYVIVRLLQNARDIVRGDNLTIYREEGSRDREELMNIRQGDIPAHTAWTIIERIECEISENLVTVPEKFTSVDTFLEQWLLKLRYSDFQQEGKTLSII